RLQRLQSIGPGSARVVGVVAQGFLGLGASPVGGAGQTAKGCAPYLRGRITAQIHQASQDYLVIKSPLSCERRRGTDRWVRRRQRREDHLAAQLAANPFRFLQQ